MKTSSRPTECRRGSNPAKYWPPSLSPSGFTLVEMLVATGLVVLIMSLFAQIYGSAIGTISEQRGMANNDQKARMLSSILRGDLQNMTYRQPTFPYGNVQGIVAMAPGDEPIIDPVNQRGYFYFSENDPSVDWDDVLQFTTMIRSGQRGDAATRNRLHRHSGRATAIPDSNHGNEPDMDDGIADGVGQSRAAEVAYFLRSGNLYRRVLLLRDPIASPVRRDAQPSNLTTDQRVYSGSGTANYLTGTGSFYNDFDYAAIRTLDSSGNSSLWFHGIDSLTNTQGSTNTPIALPWNRFGFRNFPTDTADHGMPREYLNPSDSTTFLGRFTLEESSHTSFLWPGRPSDVLDRSRTADSLTSNGVVSNFQDGDRIGEDILLSNVEAFDVQVLDNSGFTQLGNGARFAASRNPLYGPRLSGNLIFDTWHPSIDASIEIPYRPTLNVIAGTWPAGSTLQVPALTAKDSGSYQNNSLVYRQISSGTTGTKQPEFPPVPGTIVQDGDAAWQCVDNRIGLKAIQITIRYRDVTSNLPRQVTLVHSFVE